MANWYCIRTTTMRERVAEERLRAFNIETFLPQTQQPVVDRFENERLYKRALFPGYLFANCEREQFSLAAMGWRKEILRLVGIGYDPQIVPPHMIEEIRERVDPSTGFVRLDDGLKLGEEVVILHGAFAGKIGLFQRDEQRRVFVLLELLGKKFEKELPRSYVRPIDYAAAV